MRETETAVPSPCLPQRSDLLAFKFDELLTSPGVIAVESEYLLQDGSGWPMRGKQADGHFVVSNVHS